MFDTWSLNFNSESILLLLDKQGYGGAVLMDLSKAFDTLNHDLLTSNSFH